MEGYTCCHFLIPSSKTMGFFDSEVLMSLWEGEGGGGWQIE